MIVICRHGLIGFSGSIGLAETYPDLINAATIVFRLVFNSYWVRFLMALVQWCSGLVLF